MGTYTLKRHVVTGGPGIGKTTVLGLLKGLGYSVVPEAARQIIEVELGSGGNALPWKNNQHFQEKVFDFQVRAEDVFMDGHVFHDRGIVDGHGYAMHFGIQVPEGIVKHGRGRYDKVFLLDPLPVYINDTERRENQEEAKRIHQAIVDAYVHYGYELIYVPDLGSPEARVKFILDRI